MPLLAPSVNRFMLQIKTCLANTNRGNGVHTYEEDISASFRPETLNKTLFVSYNDQEVMGLLLHSSYTVQMRKRAKGKRRHPASRQEF